MRTQREAMMSVAAAAIAMSAMVACGPAVEAQVPQGGAGDMSASAGAASGSSAQQLSAAPPPPTEAECRVRASTPLPAPSGGEAESDVKQQYDAFFLAQHETFRCCFDALYAPKMPHTDGQVVLFVKLEASGKLASSEIITGETTAEGPEMNACVLDVAKALAYPKPASSAMVGYKRTFQFKARR